MKMITVGQDETADFPSILSALNYVEQCYSESGNIWQGVTIFIKTGKYEERVEIRIPRITLIGENVKETIISGGLYAFMYCEDIGKLGTFRTYTMLVDADDVHLFNLTIENTAGYGDKIGQAIALYSEGNRLQYVNCRFLGHQDTLYTGPLPPKEIEKNGFIGPKQFAPRINGRQYYRDCYIEGTIDFIFGSATAYFENCIIFQKDQGESINSFATAASTAENESYGYVFQNCRFLSDAPAGTCYLGRPWRNFAQTVILNSYLGEHLLPEGWHDWGKTEAHNTVMFAEFQNYGPGYQPEKRPHWIHILSPEEAASYSRENVLNLKNTTSFR